MKQIMRYVLGGAAGVVLCASVASATPVYVDLGGDSSVSLSNIDTGLSVVFGHDIWGIGEDTSITASLAAGFDSQTATLYDFDTPWEVDFLTFAVTGNGIGTFDIEATFGLDVPSTDSAGYSGNGAWGTINAFGATYSAGALWWDDPIQTLTLSDGNVLQIELEQGFVIGQGNDYTLSAYISNLGGGGQGTGPAAVPEPATMLLFGAGLAGLAGVRMRKR